MAANEQQTLFALDCGATNWRLYRSVYQLEHGKARLLAEPQISSLTSFLDRKLPAVILLDENNSLIASFGENARQAIEDTTVRDRVREFFKTCIGNQFLDSPQPYQTEYSHSEALEYTRLLLEAVVAQIRAEKWRAGEFDSRVLFTFAYPVHWRTEMDGRVYKDFKEVVLACFPESVHNQIRFVAEPEGAILALHHHGLLQDSGDGKLTIIADIGGSTTDIVVGHARTERGELNLIGRHGAPFGGGAYDIAIAARIADQLGLSEDVLAQPYIRSSLNAFARRLKESLSRQQLSELNNNTPPQRMISIVDEENNVYRKLIQLSPEDFRDITIELHRQFTQIIDDAMSKIGVSQHQVGQVVLVGGGAQLFSIVQFLRDRFGSERVILADNPDEIVVQGIGLEYGKSFEDYQPTFYFTPDTLPPTPEIKHQFILQGDQHEYPLLPGHEYKIGRDRSNHVHLNYEKISRFHAVLNVTDTACILKDLESTNGTFVNGTRLGKTGTLTLSVGDQIRFGDQIFILTQES
jgi:hypothetical protein